MITISSTLVYFSLIVKQPFLLK